MSQSTQNPKNLEILNILNQRSKNTLMETLEMEYLDFDIDTMTLQISMPVNPRVHQPLGLLHGGATAAMAESVGSSLSAVLINPETHFINGIQLNCSHLKSKTEGTVYATAQVIHKGRTLHSVEIKVRDEEGQLISNCQLTNIVLERKR